MIITANDVGKHPSSSTSSVSGYSPAICTCPCIPIHFPSLLLPVAHQPGYANDLSVLVFIITMLLLAADFYYLKNIAGRRLVGLRWWNEVDTGTGDSHWVFESQDRSGEGGQNATDKRYVSVSAGRVWSDRRCFEERGGQGVGLEAQKGEVGISADCEVIGFFGWHSMRNRRCGLGWQYLRL